MPRMRTQADHVRSEQEFEEATITEQIRLPGIELLHERPTDEVAEALALVLKSRSNVVELRYRVGQGIELTRSTR